MSRALHTRDELMARLSYDPVTGMFVRKSTGKATGSANQVGRIQVRVDGKLYMRARLAWLFVYGQWPDGQMDHRDMRKDNDAINNLRVCTNSQNQANSEVMINNLLGIKGVRATKNGHYQARITFGKRCCCLGTFSTIDAAKEAYYSAAQEVFGEFARA